MARLRTIQHPLAPLISLLLAAAATPGLAQGLLVDARPGHEFRLPRPVWPTPPTPRVASYGIESLEVHAKLADTTARVQVSQTFKNTGSGPLEASFVFPLPHDGAIDGITLLVDGKELAGKLLPKEEARRRYEEIVSSSKDPALLEWVGGAMFQTSVFPIPPGQRRTVTLRYTQLCRRSHGLTDFAFPLAAARYTDGSLERLSVRVAIDSPAAIKNLYSPSHDVSIVRAEDDDRHAVVTFEAKKSIPAEDFRLFYDTGKKHVKASVISYRPDKNEDGYFLLLAAPQIRAPEGEQPVAKTVVFAVDRSGSMSGEKMDQAKEALKFVLNNLRDGDLFNIVAYDSEVETFRPELEKFNRENRAAAVAFVDGLFAGGSTNIAGALDRTFAMLQDDARPAYVIFLTDGLPTVGETNEAAIAAAASQRNKVRARLFPFGVGYDVNSRLLDKLARENHGQTEFVRPEENVEDAVSKLYRRIGAPTMTDVIVSINAPRSGDDELGDPSNLASRIYPEPPLDLFAGDQTVIVGRYRHGGPATVTLRGKVAGKETSLDFKTKLATHSDDDGEAFVARLWATRRVGQLIDELDLKGHNEELVKELVDLATRHGILTPYTSFLADEGRAADDRASLYRGAEVQLRVLDETEGSFGFRQREAKAEMQYAGRPALASGAQSSGGATAASQPLAAGSLESFYSTGGRGAAFYDAVQDKQVVTANCIIVGRKTFFRRGDEWVDSAVSEEERNSAKRLERFSREFFDLIDRHGRHAAKYMAIEHPLCVKLDGVTYKWH